MSANATTEAAAEAAPSSGVMDSVQYVFGPVAEILFAIKFLVVDSILLPLVTRHFPNLLIYIKDGFVQWGIDTYANLSGPINKLWQLLFFLYRRIILAYWLELSLLLVVLVVAFVVLYVLGRAERLRHAAESEARVQR